jgi:hypothetical protein
MGMLALKLVITPTLVLVASLSGRRWGETVGGWLVGLPLTSGPVIFFLALDQGTAFAVQAAAGSLAGTGAQACFALAYVRVAERRSWPSALAAGSLAFAGAAAVLQVLALSAVTLFPMAVTALTLALVAMPARKSRSVVSAPPAWDIPARMLVATLLVLAITAAAGLIGSRLSGLLATFPIFATVLAVFAHRLQGPGAARQALRGLLMGLYGFACFFLVLGLLLPRTGMGPAFTGATFAAMLVQGISFELMRRARKP